MSLATVVGEGLGGALRTYASRVRELAAPLSDEQFWTRPYDYGNSFGHLVLHLTGNLNTYIGAQIAGTSYVRDREREFTEAAPPSKEDALGKFDEAVEMVLGVIEQQTAESLVSVPAGAEGGHFSDESRFGIFLHCISHLNHHLGQMVYLAEENERKAA